MKKSQLVLFLLLSAKFSFAQTFSDSTWGEIYEVNIVNMFPVEVSGLPSVIDSTNFGLLSVCFDIHHTYDSDLKIELQSPDGSIVTLSDHNGNSDDNYTGTCMMENATNGPIQNAQAPFTGNFYPQYSINWLNNGQDPNGTWYMVIIDEAPIDTGHLIDFSITFGENPPPSYVGGICSTSIAAACSCPGGGTECDLLPDMTNSALYLSTHWSEYSGYIREGVATPNIGWGPLEMHGTGECYCDSVLVDCSATCPDGSYPRENVNQTIYHKSGDTMSTYTRSAGYMTYHPSHGHIHVDNWTYNSIRIRGPGTDPTKWPVLGEGSKTSFCLINLGTCYSSDGYCADANGNAVDITTMPNGGLGSVTGCGTDQGIYVGKYDAYDQYLDGQEIDFGSLCDGQYYLVSITDPDNEVLEYDETNNYSSVLINLVAQPGGNCCAANFYADTTHGLAPFQVQFIDSTIPIANSWHWDFGDGDTSNEQFPIHVYTHQGTFNVTLSANTSTGCSESKVRSEYIVVDFGVGEENIPDPKSLQLRCYPNPFYAQTNVSFTLESPAQVHLYLTDVVGNVLREYLNEFHHSGKSVYTIDENKEGLTRGVYFVHAEIAKKDYVLKLVKM